jgi:chromosome segregation ATPase
MDQHRVDQLDKVLALADSAHEGEAVGAVRMARHLLSKNGLSFGDLARAASGRSRFSLSRALFSGQHVHLEAQIAQLQQQVSDLANEGQNLATQIEFWRRRAFELEQQLNLSSSDAQRWKQLARETAERLWDISQITNADEFSSPESAAEDEALPLKAAGA